MAMIYNSSNNYFPKLYYALGKICMLVFAHEIPNSYVLLVQHYFYDDTIDSHSHQTLRNDYKITI